MSVYRDEKQKTWYVSVRFIDWRGEKSRKVKRGFKTKREAQEWENGFLNESAGKLEMTFGQFVEVYDENLKERLRLTTWQTKVSIIESKMLPYFKMKRMIDIPKDASGNYIVGDDDFKGFFDARKKLLADAIENTLKI